MYIYIYTYIHHVFEPGTYECRMNMMCHELPLCTAPCWKVSRYFVNKIILQMLNLNFHLSLPKVFQFSSFPPFFPQFAGSSMEDIKASAVNVE